MSRLFGPLRQMGYVVPDVEAAMRHWVEVCGVGPWFYRRAPAAERRSAMAASAMTTSTCRSHWRNSGDMQIELIQQRCGHIRRWAATSSR